MTTACRLLALALVLLPPLGGCGIFDRTAAAPAEPETPEQRACREEARTSPAMKRLEAQSMPMNQLNADRIGREERVVLNRAYRDCLRARGLALPGGVEVAQPR